MTKNKERLNFARVLVEIKIHHEIQREVSFINEINQEITLPIKYEWLPVSCAFCHRMVHTAEVCRKKVEKKKEKREEGKKMWVIKKDVAKATTLEKEKRNDPEECNALLP